MITFDRASHRYTLDGQDVPSNTQVLKYMGLVRLDGIPGFILERARQRGSDVHELLHYYNEGDLDWSTVDPEYVGYLEAWQRFLGERAFQLRLCEYRVASRRHRVAGTLDCLGVLDGQGALIDFKTGDPDDVSADLQTAGYVLMAYETAEWDARLAAVLAEFRTLRRHAVRLRKHGEFQVETYDIPKDFTDFIALVSAWHVARSRGAMPELDELAA